MYDAHRLNPLDCNMDFPRWIDDKKNKPEKRAALRLKHMLLVASLRKYGRASIRMIAEDAKCDHSSIFCAIKRGYFTPQMAEVVEGVLGRDEVRREWLTHPLIAE